MKWALSLFAILLITPSFGLAADKNAEDAVDKNIAASDVKFAQHEAEKKAESNEAKAKKLWEKAYVIKKTSPKEAVALCEKVHTLVDESNIYYNKCVELIDWCKGKY
jgi:hypothetical protein